jgi:endonuclease V-like protein UPF0215 family
MKRGIRVLSLDCFPFSFSDKRTKMVGIVGRLGVIEGILSFSVSVDGDDSTESIIDAVKRSRFSGQIRVLALNGTVTAGLNAMDLTRLKKDLNVQPLAITRKRPRHKLLESVARKRLGRKRSSLISKLNNSLETAKISGYYVQRLKGSVKPSEELVELCVSLLRLSHLIASGVAKGESTGRL